MVSRQGWDSRYAPSMTGDTWTVKWDEIATPLDLLLLMCTQTSGHLGTGMLAARALMSGEGDRRGDLTAMLQSAAIAADFFWPSPSRRRPLRDAFPSRGADFRHVLGMDDAEPPALDLIRNDLVHVDERIEELFLADPNLSLIAWGSSRPREGTLAYMSYLPGEKVVLSLGKELSVVELEDWLRDTLARTSKMFLPMAARSGQQRRG